MSWVWIWSFVQETVLSVIQLLLLVLLLGAAGGLWLLACAINNWFPPDHRHTMLKVFISTRLLRIYCHWFFLQTHYSTFVAQRLSAAREEEEERRLLWGRITEQTWVWRSRETQIGRPVFTGAGLRKLPSDGAILVESGARPNALWTGLSLGLFQASGESEGSTVALMGILYLLFSEHIRKTWKAHYRIYCISMFSAEYR